MHKLWLHDTLLFYIRTLFRQMCFIQSDRILESKPQSNFKRPRHLSKYSQFVRNELNFCHQANEIFNGLFNLPTHLASYKRIFMWCLIFIVFLSLKEAKTQTSFQIHLLFFQAQSFRVSWKEKVDLFWYEYSALLGCPFLSAY